MIHSFNSTFHPFPKNATETTNKNTAEDRWYRGVWTGAFGYWAPLISWLAINSIDHTFHFLSFTKMQVLILSTVLWLPKPASILTMKILKERREREIEEEPNQTFESQRVTNSKRKKNAAERIGLKRWKRVTWNWASIGNHLCYLRRRKF